MWHPPSTPTATSTFRISKVQNKKVPGKDLLKKKLSPSLRGNGGAVLSSSNEDCFPVSRDVPKSALFLSLTSAISSHTPFSMQDLVGHTDIVNTIENTPGPAKDLDEPTCRVSECIEKEFSALRSKLDRDKSSNMPRMLAGNTASNRADTPEPRRLAIGEEGTAIIEPTVIDKVPRERAEDAKLPLQRSLERSVAPEESDDCATGQGRAGTPLPQGNACTRDTRGSICLEELVDKGSPCDVRIIRAEQSVDSIMSHGNHSSAHDVGTVRLDKTHNSETDRYEVEKILGHKNNKSQTFYRVKWTGYRRATWEPAVNLDDCAVVLEAYQATRCQSSKAEA